MQFVKGPIFANMILADEINRTPPKTQAALLEAMQEHQVTAAGVRYPLEEPFFVLATQNPIEMEGTYPLPEAQLDRFMFNVIVDYLPEDDEVAVVQQTTSRQAEPIEPLFDRQGRAASSTRSCARCRSPRTWCATPCGWPRRAGPAREAPSSSTDWVSWGAGLRAGQSLVLGAKARALLAGTVPRLARRHPRPGPPDLAAPDPARLPGRGRRRDRRRRDRPPARTREGTLH